MAFVFTVLLTAGFIVIAGGVGAVVYFRSAQRQTVYQEQRALENAMKAQIESEMARIDGAKEDAPGPEKPASAIAEEAKDIPRLEIRIDAEGRCSIAGQPMDASMLRAQLQRVGGQPRQVAVRVDRKCPFDHVAKLLVVCRAAGAEINDVRALDDP
jgi:hypothetical protein